MIEQGDLVLATLRMTLHGQRCLCTFWYYALADYPNQEEVDLAGEFAAAWNTQNQPGCSIPMSNELQFDHVRAQVIRPNNTNTPQRWAYADVVATEPLGQVAEGSLPSTVTAVYRRRTVLAGRRYRGRIYIPGIPVTYEDNSQLNQVGYDAISDNWDSAVLEAVIVNGNEYRPCITNAPLHSRITEITAASVDSVLRVQRRREVGVGE